MGVDGIFNDNPLTSDPRPPIADPQRDPRFTGGRAPSGSPASGAAASEVTEALLGDDRLQLSPESDRNPFQVLVNHRQRKRRRREGDASMLD